MAGHGQANATACPWHQFRDAVVEKGLSVSALREHGACIQSAAAANPVATAAAAGIAFPLALSLCTRKGRGTIFAALDTALASLLLVCLLGVVLGLPLGAAYLLWVAAGYLLRFATDFFRPA